jgi:hypothetical protein
MTPDRSDLLDFQCTGGPLKNCVEWQQLKAEVLALTTALKKAEVGSMK